MINLAEFLEPNSKVLHGREQGKIAREQLGLDRLESRNEPIVVGIPSDVYSLNSSFFVGLFGRSIQELGESEFRRRFVFECDSIISRNVEDGIYSALRNVSET